MPQEDLPSFLEWVCQPYHQYADIKPEGHENLKMINMTFIS